MPVKGLDILIEAFARSSRARRAPFTGLLIGEGPLRSSLEAQIARLGLGGRVRLLGPRPHHQLPDWYRAADLFVLPSRSEGVPIVLLESAACGTPFVASRVGGIPEIAHLITSRLVAAGDAGALARAIRPGLAEGVRAEAAHCARVRSHADAVSDLVEFFGEVLGTQQFRVTAAAPDPLTLTLSPAGRGRESGEGGGFFGPPRPDGERG